MLSGLAAPGSQVLSFCSRSPNVGERELGFVQVRLWDLTAKPIAQPCVSLGGHTDMVRSVAFGPLGDTLASAVGTRRSGSGDLTGKKLRSETHVLEGLPHSGSTPSPICRAESNSFQPRRKKRRCRPNLFLGPHRDAAHFAVA